MKRLTLIKIHLYCSGISLVFLLLMAFSGSYHLFIGNEGESVSIVKEMEMLERMNKESLMKFFEKEISEIDKDYSFDYIKGSQASLVTRPQTRTYFTLKQHNGTISIKKHVPSFLKSLFEFHKGHGAKISRFVLGSLGIVVILAAISGLWLGLTSAPLLFPTLITLGVGGVLFLVFFFL